MGAMSNNKALRLCPPDLQTSLIKVLREVLPFYGQGFVAIAGWILDPTFGVEYVSHHA